MIYKDEIYGEVKIESVLTSLINTKPFKRLKNIHQGGAIIIVNPNINHTRFEHSMGVMILIKKLNGSIEEQVAGLLHDISHTAFSHLVDYVLDYENEDYHEEIFNKFLYNTEIETTLSEHNLNIEQFLDLDNFTLLEYPLPGLCADRIDYTLRDLHKLNQISTKEINWFIEGLVLSKNRIVVKDVEYAQWFKDKYSYLIEEYFNGKENHQVNLFMKSILKKYYETNLITKDDFEKDDFFLISKIESLSQKSIHELYNEWLLMYNDNYKLKTKKREINPEILVNGKIIKLSEI